MDLRRIDWVLAKAEEARTLTQWETEFLEDMIDRRKRQSGCFHISERQEQILEAISEKD